MTPTQAKAAFLNALMYGRRLLGSLRCHSGSVESVAFSVDGVLVSAGGYGDDRVSSWGMTRREGRGVTVRDDGCPISNISADDLSFSPDGKLHASAGLHVLFWDTATQKCLSVALCACHGRCPICLHGVFTNCACKDLHAAVGWGIELLRTDLQS